MQLSIDVHMLYMYKLCSVATDYNCTIADVKHIVFPSLFYWLYLCMYLLDDMSIKLWNWDKKWSCQQVFEGHSHYVMQIVINPKDNNTFASASLDRTVKVGTTSVLFLLCYRTNLVVDWGGMLDYCLI